MKIGIRSPDLCSTFSLVQNYTKLHSYEGGYFQLEIRFKTDKKNINV